jgi:hypothetical protein
MQKTVGISREGRERLLAVVVLWLFIFFGLSPLARSNQEGSDSPLRHSPVTAFKRGETVEIKARAAGRADWMRFFYRTQDLEDFQVRPMEISSGTDYVYAFDTSALSGLEFEYFIQVSVNGQTLAIPPGAPKSTFRAADESGTPLPQVPTGILEDERAVRKFKMPVDLNASVKVPLHQKSSDSESSLARADGNIRLAWNYRKNRFGLGLDTNFTYAGEPPEGSNPVDLSNMMLSLTQGDHLLRVGDINIQESDFTVSGLGRRGVEYAYNSRKASIHLFNISAQQPQGFSGFGVPKPGLSIYGAALGSRFWKDQMSFKVIYVAGKDDLSLGSNVGYSLGGMARQGRVLAFLPKASLFSNKLTIGGEYAESRYDGNLDDEQEARRGTAWRLSGSAVLGKLNLSANFRRIGQQFNPIGYSYFASDRKIYDTNLGLNLGRINISGSYLEARDNVDDRPDLTTTKNRNANLNVIWILSNPISFNFALRYDSQNSSVKEGQVFSPQDSQGFQLSGSLNWSLGRTGSIALSLTDARQSSSLNPLLDNRNLTANLTGAFLIGNWLTLMPTLGYSGMNLPGNDERQRMFNSFLVAEAWFIPQILSVSFNGSYSQTEAGSLNISQLLNLGWNLNLNVQKWVPLIQVGSLVLSLRGSYNRSEMQGYVSDYIAWFGHLDLSF